MLGAFFKGTLLASRNALQNRNFGTALQFVRWRMPRWVPSRPRKLFFIPEKPTFDPVEAKEIVERTRLFNTQLKSLKTYMFEKRRKLLHRSALKLKARKAARLNAANSGEYVERPKSERRLEFEAYLDSWNGESRKRREARRERDKIEYERRLAEHLAIEGEADRKRKARASADVERALRDHYINESNVDDHVEKLLATKGKNYNFAVDLEGNRYPEKTDGTLGEKLS